MGWWAFDVFTQMAALQKISDRTAAQTILRNIGLFTFMIPVGISSASNFLVGTYIGKGCTEIAKRASNLSMWICFSWSLSSTVIVYYFRDGIQGIYT